MLTAENGQQALELMDENHVDLVVLDIKMPQMDGYAFTHTLRQSDNLLPILMVSARQLPADRKMGFQLGIDDYMTKPVDEEEMLLRIRALLVSVIASQYALKPVRDLIDGMDRLGRGGVSDPVQPV